MVPLMLNAMRLAKKLKAEKICAEKIFLKKNITLAQLILFGLGIALLLMGIFFGDLQDIYRKAIFICMECIGIG